MKSKKIFEHPNLFKKENELGFTALEGTEFMNEFGQYVCSKNEKFKGHQVYLILSVLARQYIENNQEEHFIDLVGEAFLACKKLFSKDQK